MRLVLAIVLFFVLAAPVAAQEQYMELLRQDIKTQKVALITEAMSFTDAEGEAFWPIYREYDLESSKLYDGLIALIKDYAANYDSMTDEKASELVKGSFKFQSDELKLRKKYHGKFGKVISPIRAAQFSQIESRLSLLIRLQISAQLPIMMEGPAPTESEGEQ
jgi:uncharacterized membrane protein